MNGRYVEQDYKINGAPCFLKSNDADDEYDILLSRHADDPSNPRYGGSVEKLYWW